MWLMGTSGKSIVNQTCVNPSLILAKPKTSRPRRSHEMHVGQHRRWRLGMTDERILMACVPGQDVQGS